MAEKNEHISLALFRCGRTQWASDHRLRGSTDLPLSTEGRAAMLREMDQLNGAKAVQIFHPPDEAATETAQALAQHIGGKLRVVEELEDPDLGLLEGMTGEQFADRYKTRHKRWQHDPLSLSPPEGESLVDARQRIFNAVARVMRKARNGGSVFVLHDYALGLLSCWLHGRPASDLWEVLRERPVLERFDLSPKQLASLEHVGTGDSAPAEEATTAK